MSDRVARAYAQSLHLVFNEELRDHLTEMFSAKSATPEQQAAIPILAGVLSVREQAAIERTLGELGVEPTPALRTYLAEGAQCRADYAAMWNDEGQRTVSFVKSTAIVSAVLSFLGIVLGVATGHPDIAWNAPLGGAFAATLGATYGYSRAGVIDDRIAAYGVLD